MNPTRLLICPPLPGDAMIHLNAILIRLSGPALTLVESELRDYGGTVDAAFPDVDAVLAHFRIPPLQKRLFILEVAGPDDLAALGRLTDTFPGQPVLVLAPSRDAELILGAMRAGATQLVPAPFDRSELRDAIDRCARQSGLRPGHGRLVVVTGVTEGCGATTIALNLACEGRRLGAERTLLVELGGRIGRLAVMLAVKPPYTTHDLLTDIEAVDTDGLRKAVTPVRDGLAILPGAYQAISVETPPLRAVLRLLTMARRLADLVILDLSGGFDEVYFGVLKVADDILLVAEQKVPSIHSLVLLRDAITGQGVHARPYYVINRYSDEMPGASLGEIGRILHGARLYAVRSDGRGVMEAIDRGKPLREVAPNSLVLEDLDRLLEGLAGGPIAPAPTRPNWLTRGLRRLAAVLEG